MTTTVIIKAHVSNDKTVKVVVTEKGVPVEGFNLEDGQTAERYVYDERHITVFEQLKDD